MGAHWVFQLALLFLALTADMEGVGAATIAGKVSHPGGHGSTLEVAAPDAPSSRTAREAFTGRLHGVRPPHVGFHYEGDVVTGEHGKKIAHGKGRAHYDNGKIYDGEWKMGRFHGQGVRSWGGRYSVTGRFENGEPVEGETTESDERQGKSKPKGGSVIPFTLKETLVSSLSKLLLLLEVVGAIWYILTYMCGLAPLQSIGVLNKGRKVVRRVLGKFGSDNGNEVLSVDQLICSVSFAICLIMGYAVLFWDLLDGQREIKVQDLMTARIGAELRRFKKSKRRHELLTKFEEIREAARASRAKLDIVDVTPILEGLCDADGLFGMCPLMNIEYWSGKGKDIESSPIIINAMEEMKKGNALRDNADFLKTGFQTVAVQPHDIMESYELFKELTGTEAKSVKSEFMFAKLIGLGLNNKQVQMAVKRASKDGRISRDRFRQYIISPINAGMLWRLSRFKFGAMAIFGFFVSVIVLMSTSMDRPNSGTLTTMFFGTQAVIAVCLFVLVLGTCTVMANPKDADIGEVAQAEEIQADTRVSNTLDKIVSAFVIQMIFVLIYVFLMKTCTKPSVSCPALSYRNPDVFCQEDDENLSCAKKLNCDIGGNMHWRQTRGSNVSSNLLIDAINNHIKLEKDMVIDDYLSRDNLLKESRAYSLPAVAGVCAEQAAPPMTVNITSRISRGRRGKLERLIDFGAPVPLKEVAFVPVGKACPADSTHGRMVQPEEIGQAAGDLALYTNPNGNKTRRFDYMIPDAVIGTNYYFMCERMPPCANASSTMEWKLVPNSYYLFGMEATCGSVDCSTSDFTDKMEDDAVMKLYFASVTHSSIGYGDISPASDRMRMVIAMHAFIMIMLGVM